MVRLKLEVPKLRGRQRSEFERWKAAKAMGIGGSTAPAALGLGRYASRLEAWAEMTGRLVRTEEEDAAVEERLRWGTLDEDGLLRELVRRMPAAYVRPSNIASVIGTGTCTQLGVFRFKPSGQPLLVANDLPWMHYSIDGLCIRRDKGGQPCLLEGKTTSLWLEGEWEQDVPEHVYIQVQHGLAVTGLGLATVAVKIGGQELRAFDIERDEDAIRMIVRGEEEFMGYVRANTPPPIEEPVHERTMDVLKRLHPKDNGETVWLPEAAAELDRRLLQVKEEQMLLEGEREQIEARLRAWIGDATFGEIRSAGVVYRLKTTEVEAAVREVEAYSYRRLLRQDMNAPKKSKKQKAERTQ